MALAAACRSPEQGILVEITQKSGSAPVEIESLTIVVGVERADILTGTFVADKEAESKDLDVRGRDLVADPYRLLIRDGLPEEGARITVAVRAFREQTLVAFAAISPQAFTPDKVLLIKVELDPERAVFVTTSGCVRWTESGQVIRIGSPNDNDCDGDSTEGVGRMDCDDENPRVGPSRPEICNNEVDDNCNDAVDEQLDNDGDQVTNCAGDCNDNDPAVFTGAPEICDGKDNDCNSFCDEGFDTDADHYTVCGSLLDAGKCVADAEPEADCNDGDATISPAGTETCDGKDNDCDGVCDPPAMFDVDGDKFSDCGTLPGAPTQGFCGTANEQKDCNLELGAIHPFQHEICNGKDDDCDATRLASSPCFDTVLVEAVNRCAMGERTCDDDDGDGSSGYGDNCTVPSMPTQTLPDVYCMAYDSAACSPAMSTDPFRCAANVGAVRKLSCTVRHLPSGALCPSRAAALPVIDAAGCSWAVFGGTAQENFTVGLAATGAGPFLDTLLACTGVFGVVSTPAKPPQPDTVYLIYTPAAPVPATQRDLVEIKLVPAQVATCPGTGLECIMQ